MEKFEGLNVSSKFAICGLPVRVDSYKTCSFGCKYCFANGRKIMEFRKNLQVADTDSIERRLARIQNRGGARRELPRHAPFGSHNVAFWGHERPVSARQ